jgi:hypothetical protein
VSLESEDGVADNDDVGLEDLLGGNDTDSVWRPPSVRRGRRRRREDDRAGASKPEANTVRTPPRPRPSPSPHPHQHGLPDGRIEDTAQAVRPYAWTGGRTRPSLDLQLETLVSTTQRGRLGSVAEHRSVVAVCDRPRSVAEVAAALSVPLGVARVILGDMAELGLITIHKTVAPDDDATQLVLMERVLSGLRRL